MITLKNQHLTVEISPIGGELRSIKDHAGMEYLYQGEMGSVNLFPYTGAVTDGKCTYRGQEFQMPAGGFLKEAEMTIERAEDTCCTLLLRSSEKTLRSLPFEFALRITYTLEDNSLSCRYHITNFTDFTMYFGLGALPVFAVPNESYSKYSVRLSEDAPIRIPLSSDGFVLPERETFPIEGNAIPLGSYPFHEGLLLRTNKKSASLADEADNTVLSVDYADFAHIMLWGKAEEGFLCMGPWCSLPSRLGKVEELSTQPSMIALEEGDYRASFKITIGK